MLDIVCPSVALLPPVRILTWSIFHAELPGVWFGLGLLVGGGGTISQKPSRKKGPFSWHFLVSCVHQQKVPFSQGSPLLPPRFSCKPLPLEPSIVHDWFLSLWLLLALGYCILLCKSVPLYGSLNWSNLFHSLWVLPTVPGLDHESRDVDIAYSRENNLEAFVFL